jgi:putative ABC transport system permease protein
MDPLHSTSAAPPPAPGADRGGPVPISPLGLAAAAAPLLFLGALSARLHLGLARQLAVGALRCAAQLSALGYVLVPIFAANSPWVTAAYAAAMCAVAAAEAVSRPARGYPGMLPQALAALALVCGAVIAFGLAVAVGARPWFDAAYLIPMLGMLLGNACSGVAVGLSAVLDELAAQRDRVEALLALGATRGEAAAPVVRRAARLALTPL